MRELQGRLPTDDELALWQLTRREYELFLDGQPDGQLRPDPLPQDGLDGDRDGQGQALRAREPGLRLVSGVAAGVLARVSA